MAAPSQDMAIQTTITASNMTIQRTHNIAPVSANRATYKYSLANHKLKYDVQMFQQLRVKCRTHQRPSGDLGRLWRDAYDTWQQKTQPIVFKKPRRAATKL